MPVKKPLRGIAVGFAGDQDVEKNIGADRWDQLPRSSFKSEKGLASLQALDFIGGGERI